MSCATSARQLMARIRDQLDREAQTFGINVVDVRIRRADLPEQNSQAVYQRMQTERQREAAEFRAQGSQRAQEIRSRADRDVTVLLAEAQSKAEQIRGEGDGDAQPHLRRGLQPGSGLLRLLPLDAGLRDGPAVTAIRGWCCKPDSEFFRYFVDPSGKSAGLAAAAAGTDSAGAVSDDPAALATRASAGRGACADFIVAVGLVLAIEGLTFAAFPGAAKRAMANVLETPDAIVARRSALPRAVIGVVLIWLVRG